MRLLFVSRSFVVSEGWMDVCVVIWAVMDKTNFDRDFDVDGQFGGVRSAFCCVNSQGKGKLDVPVYCLCLNYSWRAMVGSIFVL